MKCALSMTENAGSVARASRDSASPGWGGFGIFESGQEPVIAVVDGTVLSRHSLV